MSDDETNGSPEDGGMHTEPIYEQSDSDEQGETIPSDEPESLAADEAEKVVKICKSCMVSQRGGGGFCVKCGDELVPIRSVRDSCIGEVVGDRYTVVKTLGSGGMGDVYLGLNEPLGQRVAIKFLNTKFTSDERIVLRFLNEARSYCKVNHPNAVTLLEYGQHDDGSLYLITEFIDGQSLTEVITEKGPLSTETIVSVGVQVCEVLSAAHAQGIIHRDLKPDNLMLIPGSRGRYAVKVLDFGIAKIADDDRDGPMTETGSVFGTPEFMSPEQARGDHADPRSDIYAMGVILYYVATKTLPFRGKNKFSILNKQLNEEPLPPSQARAGVKVHPELEEIIIQCLQKSPEDRPASADELAEALEAIDTSEMMNEKGAESSQVGQERIGGDDPSAPKVEFSVDDEDALEPLGMSTFDEAVDDPLELEFSDETDHLEGALEGPTLDASAGVMRSDGLEGGSDAVVSDQDRDFPRHRRRRPDSRRRSAMIGVGATVLVILAAVVWTWQDNRGPDEVAPPPQEISRTALDTRITELLNNVENQIEDGDFERANVLLTELESDLDVPGVRDNYDRLVRRASRARNTEMQVRSALEVHRCDRAEQLHSQLRELSAGTAAGLTEEIAQCRPGAPPADAQSTVEVVDDGEPEELAPQQAQRPSLEVDSAVGASPNDPGIRESDEESGQQMQPSDDDRASAEAIGVERDESGEQREQGGSDGQESTKQRQEQTEDNGPRDEVQDERDEPQAAEGPQDESSPEVDEHDPEDDREVDEEEEQDDVVLPPREI